MNGKKYKIIDLFAGAGGLSLGAARAGFTVSGAVELDKHAISTHKLNFPETAHLEKDIKELTGRKLKSEMKIADDELTGIIGGPPCQGFSFIGRNNTDDNRNKLFAEFFRLVNEAKPVFFLAENVPGIIHPKNNAIITEALAHISKDYTILPPMTLTASDYGAPTTRTRVFFFGYQSDKMNEITSKDFAPPENVVKVTVRAALRGLTAKIEPEWQSEKDAWRTVKITNAGAFYSRVSGKIPSGVGDCDSLKLLQEKNLVSGFLGTAHSKKIAKRYGKVKPGGRDEISKSQRLKPNGFCPTLRAGTGPERGSFQAVRPLHPKENRVITPREAARLQGFPDWFQFSHTKWHSFRQIGNSVSPILAEQIFTVIKKALHTRR